MKKPLQILATAALALVILPLHAGEGWETDYAKAMETAAAEKRPVLMEFTGSDWCPPCKMLAEQVFAQDAFKTFAKDNLVLLELDFPNAKPQSAELKAQNAKLAEEYNVEGYPTVVLLSPDGKELARNVGFMPGGPDAFIAWVNKSKN